MFSRKQFDQFLFPLWTARTNLRPKATGGKNSFSEKYLNFLGFLEHFFHIPVINFQTLENPKFPSQESLAWTPKFNLKDIEKSKLSGEISRSTTETQVCCFETFPQWPSLPRIREKKLSKCNLISPNVYIKIIVYFHQFKPLE